MNDCCEKKGCEIEALRERQGHILKIVLAINAIMFIVEFTAGYFARSTALLADSLDMLGDTLVYAFSLYVLAHSVRWRAGAALFKGIVMLGFGLFVLGGAVLKMFNPSIPAAETMGFIGFIALAANLACLALLMRHRADDINMSSVWLCSRNDIVANVGVLLAAAAVAFSHSMWPDILIGLIIASLFLSSSFHVIMQSMKEIRL